MHVACRVSLLLAIAVLPWLFGGVHVWAQCTLAATALAGLTIWMFEYRGEIRPLPVAVLPLLFAVLLGLFHLVPFSPTVLASISPQAEAVWSQSGAADSSAVRLDEVRFRQSVGEFASPKTSTVSIYPASTRHDLAFLSVALTMFFLGAQLFSRTGSQKLLWAVVAANGALFAFSGIAQQLVWNGRLYGQVTLGSGGQPFAAFVNRNNAAGYLNLCLAAAIGFALLCFSDRHRPTSLWSGRPTKSRHSRRLHVMWESSIRAIGRLDGTRLCSVLVLVVIFAGLLCALSRGGWISMACATSVVAAMLAKTGRVRNLAWTSLFVVVAGFSLVQWLGQSESIGNRWKSIQVGSALIEDGRVSHWQDGLRAGSDYWFAGSGLGTYRYSYRPYVESAEQVWFFHAENQYVEAFVEGGIVGLGLLLAAIVLVALSCRRLLREPRHSASYLCGIVGTFILVSQAVHGCLDFGLYLPANMALFALMCGSVAGRAARLRPLVASEQVDRFRPLVASEQVDRPIMRRLDFLARPVFLAGLAAALFCASLLSFVEIRQACSAESALRAVRIPDSLDKSIVDTNQRMTQLGNAIDERPGDAELHLTMAHQLIQRYRLRAFELLQQQPSSNRTADQSWQMTSPIALHAAVQQYQREGRTIELENLRRSEAVQTDLKHAASHLLRSVRNCPLIPEAYLLLAEIGPLLSPNEIDAVMLQRARRLAGGDFGLIRECGFAEFQAGRTAYGLADLRRSAELDPEQAAPVLELASKWIDAKSFVNDGLPASPFLLLRLAREHFVKHDEKNLRNALLDRALRLASAAAMAPGERLQFEATVFGLQGRNREAVERWTLAVKKSPEMTEWRFELASLLRKQGNLDLAWEHARTCARMDPENDRYDALLRELVRERLVSR